MAKKKSQKKTQRKEEQSSTEGYNVTENKSEETPKETEGIDDYQFTSTEDFHVVGIGASAGGYEAIEQFFTSMPSDTGLSFVVVQHLSPDYKSFMVDLLSKHTHMEVIRVEDGMELKPNTVFLIPPKKTMILYHNRLYLREIESDQGLVLPINIFLRSLAEDKQDKAIAIILSGTGSDGSLGIRDIKGAGGMVMCQSLETSKFDGMPRNAMLTGMVDFTLAPNEMPTSIVNFIDLKNRTKLTLNDPEDAEKVDTLTKVISLIKIHKNLDFGSYKPSMILRRIEKRMGISQIDNIKEYVQFLEHSETELKTLSQDLLIGVTKFFREPDVYEYIKQNVIPEIFNERQNEPIRIWSLGCSTGEEPYSIAILLREYMEENSLGNDVTIFATDIDIQSLEKASRGVYQETIIADVNKDRLYKYFVKRKNNNYQICDKIRKMVIFAQQNILKDAPFNKIDLILCRNLLIYLKQEAQKKILHTFHFSLRKSGVLFLGKSETISGMHRQFQTIDGTMRLYRKTGTQSLPAAFVDKATVKGKRYHYLATASGDGATGGFETQMGFVYQSLMDDIEPDAILVDPNNEARHLFGNAFEYTKQIKGRVDITVPRILNDVLSIPVTTAIMKVRKEKTKVVYKDVVYKDTEKVKKLNLIVKPVSGTASLKDWVIVHFESIEEKKKEEADLEGEVYDPTHESSQRIKDLENELRVTRENLQATIEELETSNEELQASNEELMSSNEELQSTNEELQSVNEELTTVNNEYQGKLEELMSLTNDFDNLLNSTQIGTVYLDSKLQIRKFTPNVKDFISILETDIGRSIEHLSYKSLYDEFIDDIKDVLNTGTETEKEVYSPSGACYLLRIIQYRTSDNFVGGVIFTFVNIDKQKSSEYESRRLATVLRNSNDAIYIIDFNGKILDWNVGAEKLYGISKNEALEKNIYEYIPSVNKQEMKSILQAIESKTDVVPFETKRESKKGLSFDVSVTASKLVDSQGNTVSVAVTERDITELKTAQELASVVLKSPEPYYLIDLNGKIKSWNAGAEKRYGISTEKALSMTIYDLMPDEDRKEFEKVFKDLKNGKSVPPVKMKRKNGGKVYDIWFKATQVLDSEDHICAIANFESDS